MTGNAESTHSLAVIVLAGGESTRMAPHDKLDLPLGHRTVLETALASIREQAPGSDVVIVGPERPGVGAEADTPHPDTPDQPLPAEPPDRPEHRRRERPRLLRTREQPPGGGPVAGLRAGVAALPRPVTELVAVIAGDMPAAGEALPALLRPFSFGDGQIPGSLGATVARTEGALQPLLVIYRTSELLRILAGSGALRSARSVLEGTTRRIVDVPARLSYDIDTPADLAEARLKAEHPRTALPTRYGRRRGGRHAGP